MPVGIIRENTIYVVVFFCDPAYVTQNQDYLSNVVGTPDMERYMNQLLMFYTSKCGITDHQNQKQVLIDGTIISNGNGKC